MKKLSILVLSIFCAFTLLQAQGTKAKNDSLIAASFTDSTDFISIRDMQELYTWSYKNQTAETNDLLKKVLDQFLQYKYAAWLQRQKIQKKK